MRTFIPTKYIVNTIDIYHQTDFDSQAAYRITIRDEISQTSLNKLVKLIDAIERTPKITYLDLMGCSMPVDAMNTILDNLSSRTDLEELHLHGGEHLRNSKFREAIKKLKANNPNLRITYLYKLNSEVKKKIAAYFPDDIAKIIADKDGRPPVNDNNNNNNNNDDDDDFMDEYGVSLGQAYENYFSNTPLKPNNSGDAKDSKKEKPMKYNGSAEDQQTVEKAKNENSKLQSDGNDKDSDSDSDNFSFDLSDDDLDDTVKDQKATKTDGNENDDNGEDYDELFDVDGNITRVESELTSGTNVSALLGQGIFSSGVSDTTGYEHMIIDLDSDNNSEEEQQNDQQRRMNSPK